MPKRKTFSRTERVRLFELHKGRCHLCSIPIKVGEAWDLEHVVPWELTQDDSDDNVRPAHKSCHRQKTSRDICVIRKADRVRAKHLGVIKPRSRLSHPFLKRKINGEIVRKHRD